MGPPDEEFQTGLITSPDKHALYLRRGWIVYGASEDILVNPDEPDGMYWVRFEDDRHKCRPVKDTWLVRKEDLDQQV